MSERGGAVHVVTTRRCALIDSGADGDDVYEAMDWLLERQPAIERKLATRHLQQGALALYDLSSARSIGCNYWPAAWGVRWQCRVSRHYGGCGHVDSADLPAA